MTVITEIKFRSEEEHQEIDKVMSTITSEGWSVKSEREERFEYKGNTAKTTTFVLIRTI